ncbi:VOC family protein [Brucella pituitosa]|uniref:Glyoxalase n=1 Tax=Brucella pituitosa TaxID=571256 RepID=A0A643F297_9HYPH|nr:VOC family protein [Brucella pituitosa]KAB0571637.1 glyoxalase [Brucella pituitosa]TCQ81138.1 catechol 2,3-dioxygenase-like lactoylglutathione lyase family enzyme [Ochrobactrum sp. BH3]
MSLFDHIGFQSRNLHRSLSFYESCMPKLGLAVIAHSDSGFFVSGGERAPVPFLWIHSGPKPGADEPGGKPGNHLHLMFNASSRDDVEAFHRAALQGGGSESGAPAYQGPEEMGYYAALVFDPDGNTLEAGFRQRVR